MRKINFRFTPWKTAVVLVIGYGFGVFSSQTAFWIAVSAALGFDLWE